MVVNQLTVHLYLMKDDKQMLQPPSPSPYPDFKKKKKKKKKSSKLYINVAHIHPLRNIFVSNMNPFKTKSNPTLYIGWVNLGMLGYLI